LELVTKAEQEAELFYLVASMVVCLKMVLRMELPALKVCSLAACLCSWCFALGFAGKEADDKQESSQLMSILAESSKEVILFTSKKPFAVANTVIMLIRPSFTIAYGNCLITSEANS